MAQNSNSRKLLKFSEKLGTFFELSESFFFKYSKDLFFEKLRKNQGKISRFLESCMFSRQLEKLACKIVNNLYLSEPDGPFQVRKVLLADCKLTNLTNPEIGPYEDYLDQKFNKSREIMAIAYKAKAMVNFFAKNVLKKKTSFSGISVTKTLSEPDEDPE